MCPCDSFILLHIFNHVNACSGEIAQSMYTYIYIFIYIYASFSDAQMWQLKIHFRLNQNAATAAGGIVQCPAASGSE